MASGLQLKPLVLSFVAMLAILSPQLSRKSDYKGGRNIGTTIGSCSLLYIAFYWTKNFSLRIVQIATNSLGELSHMILVIHMTLQINESGWTAYAFCSTIAKPDFNKRRTVLIGISL